MIRSASFFFSLVILVSCSKNSSNDLTGEMQLTGITKSIQLPEGWGQFNLTWRVSPSGNILLINFQTSEIALSSGLEDSFLQIIKLEPEGPDGLGGSIQDAQWSDDGTIWLSVSGDKMVQLDQDGKLLQRISLALESLFEQNVSLLNFNFVVLEDGIFFPAIPLQFQWNTLSFEEFQSLPNLLKYDFETQEFGAISTFSKDFLGNNLNKNIMPMVFRGLDEAIIINHNFKDIWVFHKGEIQQKEVSFSQFSPTPPTSSKDIFEEMDQIMWLLNYSDAYWNLVVLPDQQFIARFFKFDERPEEEGFGMEFVPAKWGLVLVDSNYNKHGEFIFPTNGYNPQLVYTDSEGIWVCTTHPNRSDIVEGELTFELLSVN